ncbi:MAG: hypothetical protein CM1200mP38_2240 [Dehalococcoidia bacterium]|nr:MAG: hypothetical protein CM1200mP38_2240 [Dehalococcoidia bacterium]
MFGFHSAEIHLNTIFFINSMDSGFKFGDLITMVLRFFLFIEMVDEIDFSQIFYSR